MIMMMMTMMVLVVMVLVVMVLVGRSLERDVAISIVCPSPVLPCRPLPRTRPMPAQDSIAKTYAYFETLVWYWQNEQRIRWDRIERLSDPSKLAMVATVFSSTRQSVPELFEKLEPRLGAADALAKLSASELSSVAWAFAANNSGSASFLSAVAAAVKAKPDASPADVANLTWALNKRGVATA